VYFKPDFGPQQEYFLGTGGVYNLYTALTDEKLPGRAKATAKVRKWAYKQGRGGGETWNSGLHSKARVMQSWAHKLRGHDVF
jgi:hypothetical protein